MWKLENLFVDILFQWKGIFTLFCLKVGSATEKYSNATETKYIIKWDGAMIIVVCNRLYVSGYCCRSYLLTFIILIPFRHDSIWNRIFLSTFVSLANKMMNYNVRCSRVEYGTGSFYEIMLYDRRTKSYFCGFSFNLHANITFSFLTFPKLICFDDFDSIGFVVAIATLAILK